MANLTEEAPPRSAGEGEDVVEKAVVAGRCRT